MNKELGIGFIDLLTGFLCSTIVLMLIYSFSKSNGAELFESSDAYFLVVLKVPSNKAKLRFEVERPNNSQKTGNRLVNGQGLIIKGIQQLDKTESDFISIFGPVKSNSDPSNEYYKLYASNINKASLGVWKINCIYYDDERLNSNSNDITHVLTNPIEIKYKTYTKQNNGSTEEPMKLRLGKQNSIVINIE